ncbi:MAG: Trm112 family protein [Betaproteobacteria bacterium]|nr:Trm112 family protein [Betaproteobacteria bacterium]
MDKKLLELLVCPLTKGPLVLLPDTQELVSLSARLAYPIRDGIPVMLEAEARSLGEDEYKVLREKNPPKVD